MLVTCKQVSHALAKARYYNLPWLSRAAIKLHVWLCAICGRSNRQVMVMQDVLHEFSEHEYRDQPSNGFKLSAEARARMQSRLKSQDGS